MALLKQAMLIYNAVMTDVMRLSATLLQPLPTLVGLTLAAVGLLGGAWYFQLVLGFLPCKLCLEQRWPHYAAAGLGGLLLLGMLTGAGRAARPGLMLMAAVFALSAIMGSYHAGVEWGWFLGPSDCGGAAAPAAASMQDFMKQLQTTRVVSCTEAAWRFAGLSLAGWNALISLALALWAMTAAAKPVHGSSSLSQ